MFTYNFMKMAFLAIVLCAPAYALMGTLIVDMRLSFLAESLGHSALTGVALGVLLGISPNVSVMVFALLFAILLTFVKKYSASGADTTIAVFSAAAMSLGIMLLSRGGIQSFSWVFVGDVLSIRKEQLVFLSMAIGICLFVWAINYNKLLLISLQEEWARTRSIHADFLQLLWTCLIALIISLGIPIIGTLVISSFLVLPAAAARNIAKGIPSYHAWAVGIALSSGIGGLMVSYLADFATGATIVLLMALWYFITLLLRILFRRGK